MAWLGEVPDHWSLARLGSRFVERREKVSDQDYEPLSVTKEGVVPQLETAAKSDDGENRKKVLAGDFVINSRSDRKGSAGVACRDGSVSLICTVLTPQPGIHGSFVHHLLRSVPFQEEFYRYGKGIVADLWSTNYSEMRNILLAIPPLLEQGCIADFLDREVAKIDALLAEQERMIELLQEKRQAVISHAVTKGLNSEVPMKPSGVEWLGDLPEHWAINRIAQVSTKITNGYVGPTRDILVDEGVRYLQSLHIKNNAIRFDVPYFVTAEWSQRHSKSILEAGDVLIVQTGDIGQVAVVNEDFAGCNCHALIIVAPAKSSINGDWLAWVLNSHYGFHSLLSIQTGALHPHLNCGNVRDISVPVPPIEEQVAIVRNILLRVSEIDGLAQEARRAVELLRERRSALISAAVTGQIDVRGLVEQEAA